MKGEQKENGSNEASPSTPDLNPILEKTAKSNSPDWHLLPQRYRIKDSDDGRILTCLEAPNISVYVETG